MRDFYLIVDPRYREGFLLEKVLEGTVRDSENPNQGRLHRRPTHMAPTGDWGGEIHLSTPPTRAPRRGYREGFS